MKDLTISFNSLLQDKRVRSEQSKYEAITRQKSTVLAKYRRVYQEFLDLESGLESAKQWYKEMRDTVNSLEKNVETFVSNRRSEGAQLLHQIEADRSVSSGGQADRERERLRGLMERMSMDPSTSPSSSEPPSRSQTSISPSAHYPPTNFAGQYQVPASPPPQQVQLGFPSYGASQTGGYYQQATTPRNETFGHHGPKPALQLPSNYDPSSFARREYGQATSPPPSQQHFSQNQYQHYQLPGQSLNQQQFGPYVPPPPPPPGPPPLGPRQTFSPGGYSNGQGQAGYQAQQQQQQQQRMGQQSSTPDPWAGLNSWK